MSVVFFLTDPTGKFAFAFMNLIFNKLVDACNGHYILGGSLP